MIVAKVKVELENRKDVKFVERALQDKAIKALVLASGALLGLPTDRSRQRVLKYVVDRVDEEPETE